MNKHISLLTATILISALLLSGNNLSAMGETRFMASLVTYGQTVQNPVDQTNVWTNNVEMDVFKDNSDKETISYTIAQPEANPTGQAALQKTN